MLLAFELKKSLAEVYAMEQEEIGWWFAWFKVKQERDAAANKRRSRGRGSRTPVSLWE